jgi:hypothetical protein|nr:MAG TPA: protein of unknown function DUF29 [Caudoviricetes sp.]
MDKNEQIEMSELWLRLQSIIERVGQIADLIRQGELDLARTEMDELYMESVQSDARKLGAKVERIIEHVLKLAYCGNYHDVERDARGWEVSINKQRMNLYSSLDWGQPKRQTNVIRGIENRLKIIYENAIHRYFVAIEEHPSLDRNKNFIPEECPWTLEDLMDLKIIDLVKMLDGHTEYYWEYLYMNICPGSKYEPN